MHLENYEKLTSKKELGKLRIATQNCVKEKEYWQGKMAGELIKTCFPYDSNSTIDTPGKTDTLEFTQPGDLFERLMHVSNRYDYTLYMILTAGLKGLLRKYVRTEDIIVGAPTYKQQAEGEFVNTVLTLRDRVTPGMTFKELLLQVKATIIEADNHKNYPVELLLEHLGMTTTGKNFPLFDIAILLENIQDKNDMAHVPVNMRLDFKRTETAIEGKLAYNANLYRRTTAERIVSHFTRLLEVVMTNINVKIDEIDIFSDREKEQLLFDFNETGGTYPCDTTIPGLFEAQVEKTPNATAVVRGDKPDESLSYRKLNETANRLAHYLLHRGAAEGIMVGLLVERSPDMIISILGILKTGAAYVPLDPKAPTSRIDYILSECRIKLLVTVTGITEDRKFKGEIVDIGREDDYREMPVENPGDKIYPGSLAYVIFTSGSTGRPKGVPITHANLSPLMHWGRSEIGIGPADRVIQNLSYYFDGSVWEIFISLTTGAALYIITEEIQLNPTAYLELMHNIEITAILITPTQYRYLMDAGQMPESLRYLFIGAEKLTVDLAVHSFESVDKTCRVFNMYGPTEATIISSVLEIRKNKLVDYRELSSIPIGRTVGNTRLFVLDENLRLSPIGVEGELYIAGDALARGYLNDPVKTASAFIANPFPNAGGERLYKTGDRGRWLEDGIIEFLGRTDHQVKIRGYRIEPGEIENALLMHNSVKDALVTTRVDEKGENYLCAYIIPYPDSPDKSQPVSRFKSFLSEKLPDYMVPAYFMMLEKMPLNPNGKVDLKALPEPGVDCSCSVYAAPRNEIENTLADIWAETLETGKEKIGIDDDFFLLGGHSLKANSVAARIYQTLEVKLPLALLFESPTIRELASRIKDARKETYEPIEPADKKDYYPLTPQQERLYILQQMELGSTGYNMPYALPLKEDVDQERLENTLDTLIRRHESFRTSFLTVNERPFQVVHGEVDFMLKHYDLRDIPGNSMEEFQRAFVKPFDLSRAPLLRAALIRTGNAGNMLMMDLHHIITDGTSQGLLTNEFMTLYAGEDIPEPRIHYKDYAQWLNDRQQTGSIKRQEAFWLHSLSGDLPVLNLPIDYPRPEFRSFDGNSVRFELTGREKEDLKRLGQANGATLYMTLLSVFTILLSKLSGDEDIIIGTPIAGRRHPDTQKLIGMLVNTLAMRNYPNGDKTINQFLAEVKSHTILAYENQECQFDRLVEKLSVPRDTSRNPVFDIMFNLLNQEAYDGDASLLNEKAQSHYENVTSKFDLNLTAVEREDRLILDLEYCTKLFKKKSIDVFIRYFKHLAAAVTANPEQLLGELELLSQNEKEVVLDRSQGPNVGHDDRLTIHKMFEEIAVKYPGNTALVMGDTGVGYKELNRKANRLAWVLRSKGVTVGTVVGLMVERSVEMIVGILATLKAGGACLPIDTDYPEERKQYMVENSGVTKILINNNIEEFSHWLPQGVEPIDLRDDSSYDGDGENLEHINSGLDLLYVIYTSGSTGKPKGVMIEHRNLVNLIRYQYSDTGIDFSRVLQFTTISFDVSFQEIFSTLLAGGELHLISKETRNNIPELFSAINESEIKTLFLAAGFLKFVFTVDEYIETFPAGISHLVTAGEQIVVNNRLKDYLIRNGVYLHNHYGPSETHVVTVLTLDPGDDIPRLPSIGRPVRNTGIYILDKHGNVLPEGATGELVISGIQVGRGYLNRPELSADKFVIFNRSHRSYRTYKTGDLARYLPDGALEFLGRMDHQVKIRGFRIELGEIESRLLEQDEVKEAVVLAREKEDGEKYLCAYIIAESADTAELRDYLARKLPDYMVPAFFIKIEELPLTPNGKIDRNSLPVPDLKDGSQTYSPPQNHVEETLVDIWSQVLELEKEGIGIDDNFFHLGGHSLKATIVAAKIHKELGVKLPLAELFKRTTIRQLADHIGASETQRFLAIEPAQEKQYYLLSSAQKRLYILQQMETGSTSYNLPAMVELDGRLDKKNLEEAFKRLIARHESLRTFFEMVDNEPVQRIHKEGNYKFQIANYQQTTNDNTQITKIIRDFIQPFDLTKAPLLRVGLIREEDGKHILMVDMHHIITDGASLEIFTREFMALYAGKKLPKLRLQYKDFSQWQNSKSQKGAISKQGEYWLTRFQGEIPVIQLPTDHARPAIQSFAGSKISFRIEAEQASALKRLALAEGTSLYMLLLSLYTIFLSKITGQEDIVVGTPVAGRRHADLDSIIGMFVNTLGIRSFPTGKNTFIAFLREVKETTLEAFENQDYPFEELVEKVVVDRDPGRNPLFDVMFILQNTDKTEVEIPGLTLKPYKHENEVSKFDLTLQAIERGGSILLNFEYCTKLFRAETIERFSGYLDEILHSVLKRKDQQIQELDIIPEPEKQLLLDEFNKTGKKYPAGKTIHRLFEEQVERTPDRIALSNREGTQLTYSELNKTCDQVARLLNVKGVVPGAIVGIMIERSFEMVVWILGILKSGGAYLPIDPGYPRERIDYMLKDSNSAILVSVEDCEWISGRCDVVRPDQLASLPPAQSSRQVHLYELCYIIYTSGSTGKPKGVMIEHNSVVNILQSLEEKYPLAETGAYLLKTSFIFDVSVTELFGWFLRGGRLATLDKNGEKDPRIIFDTIAKGRVTHINFVPSMFSVLLSAMDARNIGKLSSLKYIFLAGEALSPVLAEQFNRLDTGIRLENIYGPTEGTIYASQYPVREWNGGSIPIGRPLPNVRLYIFDRYSRLQPIGVPGELCITGAGLARGYLNRPELTAQRFSHTILGNKPLTLYRTGDLTRWQPDGNIEFLGRLDHQVKIRGYRIELGEIETQLEKHNTIQKAVVLAKKDTNGEGYLCAYVIADNQWSVSQLKSYLARQLPDYMIPAYFTKMDKMPLTHSGKVDRKALPEPDAPTGTETYTAPRNEIEETLVTLWSEVLGIEEDRIGIDDNFFQLGGHSLKAAILASGIQKNLNIQLPLGELFKTPTIRGIAAAVPMVEETIFARLENVGERDFYQLSYNQERLFLLHQLAPESPAYNMPGSIMIAHDVDGNAIKKALHTILERHESLRTGFKRVDHQKVQFIIKEFELPFYQVDISSLSAHEKKEEMERINNKIAGQPFDLEAAPLFRSALIKHDEQRYELIFNIHHIVTDGWSMEILKQEVAQLYEAYSRGKPVELEPPGNQYKDFAEWQRRRIENPETKEKSHRFWLKKLEALPEFKLPRDYDESNSAKSSGYTLAVTEEITRGLRKVANTNNTTLFTVLYTAFNMILSRVSGQKDVVTAILGAGREHPDLHNIVGFFVNTIVIHCHIRYEENFPGLLARVNSQVLESLLHQVYPLELVLDDLEMKFPDICVLFNMFTPGGAAAKGGLEYVEPHHTEDVQDVKFELAVHVSEREKGIEIQCNYRNGLFDKETVEYMMQQYLTYLRAIASNPGKQVSDYILPKRKKRMNFSKKLIGSKQ